eukprot:38348-Alexandrium_andersonii.AAC.1
MSLLRSLVVIRARGSALHHRAVPCSMPRRRNGSDGEVLWYSTARALVLARRQGGARLDDGSALQ